MAEKKHPSKKGEKDKEQTKGPKVKDLPPDKDPSGGKRHPDYK